MELLKVSKDKRALKFIKKRVGSVLHRARVGVWLAAVALGDMRLLLAGGHAHPRQEKAGGAEQRAGSHEEGGGQEGLMNPPPIKDGSYSFVYV
jgi:hypothetical protein